MKGWLFDIYPDYDRDLLVVWLLTKNGPLRWEGQRGRRAQDHHDGHGDRQGEADHAADDPQHDSHGLPSLDSSSQSVLA